MPDDLTSHSPAPLAGVRPKAPLTGTIRVPGDKSISHRALMLGALAVGRTEITGLLEGEDVLATAAAMRALGAGVERQADGRWLVDGVGVGGLAEPADMLDLGNSGTAARLLLGILATHPITCFVTGDGSLRSRPMRRVTEPLSRFGARFTTREGGLLPLAVSGAENPVPIEYTLPVPSAQVKSAVLLAGLNTPGETTVIEPQATRDHTERMLGHFGATVRVEPIADGGKRITLVGQPELTAAPIAVPADISSAAFALVAGLIVPGSEVTVEGVGLNPSRIGLLAASRRWAPTSPISTSGSRAASRSPICAFARPAAGRRHSARARAVDDRRIPDPRRRRVLRQGAHGDARPRRARVKESDRLTATATGLAACGVRVSVEGDDLIVEGAGNFPAGGALIATRLDHRIAMAFLVMGLATNEPVVIDDVRTVATSFPGFVPLMNQPRRRVSGDRVRPAALPVLRPSRQPLRGFLRMTRRF
jgi:3-phosphoshikimate 1-carboxyvinyltransferase